MMPEVILDVQSEEIVAKTRKLKANWTREAAQDLRAMHNIDAASQLSDLLAAEINAEIDQEILNDLRGLSGSISPPPPVFVPTPVEAPWGVRRKKKQYRSIDDPWDA